MLRVLLCDDHSIFRTGLRLALGELGAEFAEAASGEEALELLAGGDCIDLVLLDLVLPGVDGWTTLRKIRSSYPTVPVVVVSASESPSDCARALDDGAAGFLPKSSPPDILSHALRIVLGGGEYVPASLLRASLPFARDERTRHGQASATDLTSRQLEVLLLVSRGYSNREVGEMLKISERTVQTHLAAIYLAWGVQNRTEAALEFRRRGLDPDADS